MASDINRAPLVIDVAGINKHFGDKHVVKDLALQVRQGEIFGFPGPHGSGKTTSIRLLCGLLTPDSGRGSCPGLDVLTRSAKIKRQVGYMTQKFSLWDDLTIGENLDFVARMFGMKKRRDVVAQALDEPTAGVDSKARRDFWEEIHRLAADGITVLVSTHHMDEAERCHRLAYRLMAAGTAAGRSGGGPTADDLGNRRRRSAGRRPGAAPPPRLRTPSST